MAASTNPWLLLLLVLLALNFARIVSESLILDHRGLEDDEFDPIELELEEDFWASDNSIPNISPDCERPCLVNACSDEEWQEGLARLIQEIERERYSYAVEILQTEKRELKRALATMELACFVVTALLPSVAFSMLKLYSSNISSRKTMHRAFSCRRCPYLARSVTKEDVYC
uniref:GTD-binding domain-containing protein n=1 Tax=Populus trichocarpa TaxID=3694 RepID=A0A3N7F3A3_POPTR|eukprot:XP_024458261.1 uncharacterized protein LOC7485509 isoform X2 [Populus trichocarpa]